TPKKTPKREFSSCLNNLLQQGRTVFNLKLEGETCLYDDHLPCSTEQAQQKIIIIRPIRHGAQRIGSLVVIKFGGAFNLDALVLLETALSCATIELLKRESKNNTKEIYKQTLARTAIQALSFSEKQIVDKLISELNHKDECIIIARKLAKSLNVSHSVLICALRKLESAGLIKSRSLGAKGTHISLLNPYLRSSI
ncbi:MAG: hypothetical protein GX764_07550, partial [Firmicutes bacterium]|nr:hypothetical protein [Bacillota bacterium]